MKEQILKTLKWIGIVLACLVGLFVVVFFCLTLFEFKPKDVEQLSLNGNGTGKVEIGQPLKIMSWNTGYGALGDNADFFMDGGKMVNSATKNRVKENISAIADKIEQEDADFTFLQEVDLKSKRSYKINERDYYTSRINDVQMTSAIYFKSVYIPYPLPVTMGKVTTCLTTLSKTNATDSKRIQLPCPFKWPTRAFNLKRCLMVNRIPVSGTDKELVLVNLHLEAYDSGEGKIAQTKMLAKIFEEEVEKGNYVIAGGDLNQTFSTVDQTNFPTLEKNGIKMWQPGVVDTETFAPGTQFVMSDTVPSCRSLDEVYAGSDKDNFQYYAIDGFIVSPNVKVDSYHTDNMEFRNTDHNPIIMNFTLK